ncbi:hypothetical protein RUND412_003403 [Rhizina undulata]
MDNNSLKKIPPEIDVASLRPPPGLYGEHYVPMHRRILMLFDSTSQGELESDDWISWSSSSSPSSSSELGEISMNRNTEISMDSERELTNPLAFSFDLDLEDIEEFEEYSESPDPLARPEIPKNMILVKPRSLIQVLPSGQRKVSALVGTPRMSEKLLWRTWLQLQVTFEIEASRAAMRKAGLGTPIRAVLVGNGHTGDFTMLRSLWPAKHYKNVIRRVPIIEIPPEITDRMSIQSIQTRFVNLEEDPLDLEPDGTESEDTEPEDTEQEDTKSEDTEPEDTEPEDTEPEDTEPEDTEPEDKYIVRGNAGRWN